jgi:hypothetical protein
MHQYSYFCDSRREATDFCAMFPENASGITKSTMLMQTILVTSV